MTEKSDTRPVPFKLAYWWAFGFATVFLLYGLVTLVLSFLDRQYANLAQPFGFLLIGGVLMAAAWGLRNRRSWAWYGEIGINGLIIIAALAGFRNYATLIILALAAVALALLLTSATKRYLFPGR